MAGVEPAVKTGYRYAQPVDSEHIIHLNSDTRGTVEDVLGPVLERIKVSNDKKVREVVERIERDYNVTVEVLNTKEDFYSKENIRRTAEEKVYFVSRDALEETERATRYLLDYTEVKLELANAKRIDNAAQKSLNANERIQAIKQAYIESHAGKEPSLGKIAKILNEEKYKSPSGKSGWAATTVMRVLEKSKKEVTIAK